MFSKNWEVVTVFESRMDVVDKDLRRGDRVTAVLSVWHFSNSI